MKQKIIKNTFFFIILLLTINTYAQNIEHNLEKYWYYRDRFRNLNIIIADPDLPGTNLPVRRLEGIFIDENGFTKFSKSGEPRIENGDATARHGAYIAMLATEYRLLKDYGQDYSQTLTELYYALKTIERLDLTAERFLRISRHDKYPGYNENPAASNFEDILEENTFAQDLNGFFLRTDLDGPPCSSDNCQTEHENKNYYNALDYNNGLIKYDDDFDNTGIVVEKVSSQFQKEIEVINKTVVSQDQVWHLLYGLALVKKLVDDPTLFEDTEGEMLTIRTMTKKITFRLIEYMHNILYYDRTSCESYCTSWQAIRGKCKDCDGDKCPWWKWKLNLCGNECREVWGWQLRSPIMGTETKFHGDCDTLTRVPESAGGFLFQPFAYGFAEAGDWITDKDYGTLHYANSYFWEPLFLDFWTTPPLYDEDTQYAYLSLLTVTNKIDESRNIMDMLLLRSYWARIYAFDKPFPLIFPLVYQVLHEENADQAEDINFYNKYKDALALMLDDSNDCGFWWIPDLKNDYHYLSSEYWVQVRYEEDGDIDKWPAGFQDGLDYMLLHNLYWLMYLNPEDKYITQTYPDCETQPPYCFGDEDLPIKEIAANNIYASNVIEAGSHIIYEAGNEVILEPGFDSQEGSEFEAISHGARYIYEYKDFHPDCDFSFLGDNYYPTKNVSDNYVNCNDYFRNTENDEIQDTINNKFDNKYEITIFPNPTYKILNINLSNNFKNSFSVKLINSYGQIEFQQKYYRNPVQLDLSNLQKGMYVVEIIYNNNIYTEKIILQ